MREKWKSDLLWFSEGFRKATPPLSKSYLVRTHTRQGLEEARDNLKEAVKMMLQENHWEASAARTFV